LLLIAAGLALLAEWAIDLRRKVPVRRSSGFIGILILLAFIGVSASGWQHLWGPLRAQFGEDGDDFFNAFGQPQHDLDQQLQSMQIAANSTITLQNPRGDINVASGDGNILEVQAHEVAYANSDSDAKKIFDAEAARVTVSGSAVLVKSESNNSGKLNLTVTVPRNARVQIESGKGDVTVTGLGQGLAINSINGDTHLNSIVGSVQVHFANSRHDFSAHQIEGDLTADGNCNDITLSEVKGRVGINGEIFGEVHFETIGGPVSLHTSITDLQVAQLPGDLTLDSDNLRVTEARGQVHVITHSKDVELTQIAGDSYVQNHDGSIAIEPTGNFNVEARNTKGDVELTLPNSVSARVQVSSRNGDIVSEFAAPGFGDATTKNATFNIGGGAAHIQLSADNGDVRIKRGSGNTTESATPATPSKAARTAESAVPAKTGNAPHLKAPKAQQQQTPTQQ
jgi:DUF4097 and DUF4098 domain-containing protein YvlB